MRYTRVEPHSTFTNFQKFNSFLICGLFSKSNSYAQFVVHLIKNLIQFKLYKGASHGLAGILQVIFKKLFSVCLANYYCLCGKVLLGFRDYLEDNPDAERDVKNSVDYILHTQKPDGNFPIVLHDNMEEKKELVHW